MSNVVKNELPWKVSKIYQTDGSSQRDLFVCWISYLQGNTRRMFPFFSGTTTASALRGLSIGVMKSLNMNESSFSFRSSLYCSDVFLYCSLMDCNPGFISFLWLVASFFPRSHWLVERLLLKLCQKSAPEVVFVSLSNACFAFSKSYWGSGVN